VELLFIIFVRLQAILLRGNGVFLAEELGSRLINEATGGFAVPTLLLLLSTTRDRTKVA
jgi:hypothetical protein